MLHFVALLCRVCAPLARAVKVFATLEAGAPGGGGGEGGGVGVGDLLPLADLPRGPHPADPVTI